MCNCQKDAQIFLSCGIIYKGYYCYCRRTWTTEQGKQVTLEDLKPEVLSKAQGDA